MDRRDARKTLSEVDTGIMGAAISNAAAKLQANFRGRFARRSIAVAMAEEEEEDDFEEFSDGDSDGDSDYIDSDDDGDVSELLRDFEAEYGDRAYYLADLERLIYTGGVVREAGTTAIA